MPKPNPAMHDPHHDPRPVVFAIIAVAVVIVLLIYYFKLRR
jgi:preprotein translocase subunit Sec61beta